MLMMDDYLSNIQNFYNTSDNIIMQCDILAGMHVEFKDNTGETVLTRWQADFQEKCPTQNL